MSVDQRAQLEGLLKLVEQVQSRLQATGTTFRTRVLLQMLVIELHQALDHLSNSGGGFT